MIYRKNWMVVNMMCIILMMVTSSMVWSQVSTYKIQKFEKKQLSEIFYAEGAGIGDVNGDGHPDVIAGPYWYVGPEYVEKHAYYEPVAENPYKYSKNFFVETEDVNEDGWTDILIVGFPGEESYWFENPKKNTGYWKKYLIHPKVDNESPHFYDIDHDGKLELVFQTDHYLGFAKRHPEDVTLPWEFIKLYDEIDAQKFTHGFGIGDVDGDNQEDILMANGWFKNPGRVQIEDKWTYTEVDFGIGGAQMYTYDVNGDGLKDVITSLSAHGWGLAWYEQIKGKGGSEFKRHLIMGEKESENKYGVKFAELHAIDFVDMDQDGIKDLVTGKRFWAHGPDGHYFHNNAAVLYWFKLDLSGKEPDFIPHLIDYNSGVGVEVETGDLTGNGLNDIVISNKKGTFVFLHHIEEVSREVWEYMQPKPIKGN